MKIKQLVKFFVFCAVFLILGGLAVYVFLSTRFERVSWHVVTLTEEFRASKIGEISDFDGYLRLEKRLFKELDQKIYRPSTGLGSRFNRYSTGSFSDSSGFAFNWNKTFELPVENPRGGVLMMHGLTDSPYSLRALALNFQDKGFWVVGLRAPGHGTIPAALLDIHWEDWAAAMRLGALRVKERIGNTVPFYILGYSTGAALAVDYALDVLDGDTIPETNGLILISPALGLPRVAKLAKVQLGLSKIPGLGKLAWESVMLEYDPYKYNSFPVNAAEQIYLLALAVQKRVEKMVKTSKLDAFPDVIAFQSIVDATIKAEGVVENFLIHLPGKENTLVVYDVNQKLVAQGLLAPEVGKTFRDIILEKKNLSFYVEFVTNMTKSGDALREVIRNPLQDSTSWKEIPFSWPEQIYSLSHVSLPYKPDDPIYGKTPDIVKQHVRLGNISARGEKSFFAIPEKDLMRLRYNPFYDHMENRILSFLEASANK